MFGRDKLDPFFLVFKYIVLLRENIQLRHDKMS